MSDDRSATEDRSDDAMVSGELTEKCGTDPRADQSTGRPNLLQTIEAMKQEQKQLRDERQRVANEVNNALKKKKRLRCKASQLTDADLIEVLQMRRAAVTANPTPSPASASTAASSPQMP